MASSESLSAGFDCFLMVLLGIAFTVTNEPQRTSVGRLHRKTVWSKKLLKEVGKKGISRQLGKVCNPSIH